MSAGLYADDGAVRLRPSGGGDPVDPLTPEGNVALKAHVEAALTKALEGLDEVHALAELGGAVGLHVEYSLFVAAKTQYKGNVGEVKAACR